LFIINYKDFFHYKEFRPQQEEIIQSIEVLARNKENILLQGPNGLGKTSISLSSLLPIVFDNELKIIYLCRTHSQNKRVMEELEDICNNKNINIRAITIQGRKSMCLNKELLDNNLTNEEFTEECDRLRDKTHIILQELLENDDGILPDENIEYCEYYFKFLKGQNFNVILENINLNRPIKIDPLIEKCKNASICPYYLIKELMTDADVIVCNYQWVFHPHIKEHFLQNIGEQDFTNCILILDECHNVIDVATENNSRELSLKSLVENLEDLKIHKNAIMKDLSDLRNLIPFIKQLREGLIKREVIPNASGISNFVFDLLKEIDVVNLTQLKEEDYSNFTTLIDFLIQNFEIKTEELLYKIKKVKEKGNGFPEREEGINPKVILEEIINHIRLQDILKFKEFLERITFFSLFLNYHKHSKKNHIKSFAKFWQKIYNSKNDPSYFLCYCLDENEKLKLEFVSLDPSELTTPILNRCYSSLSLSGTINPDVYENLLRLTLHPELKKYNKIIADSPFKKENVKAMIIKGISSRAKTRNKTNYIRYNKKIEEVISSTPGGIGIFCPSYGFLNGLQNNGLKRIAKKYNKEFFMEKRDVSPEEKRKMIEVFKNEAKKNGAVLLGVCRGKYSEGEDYPADAMNAVIIAGLPLQAPIPRIKAKIEYYKNVFGGSKGELLGYDSPAMNSANQAAGRPIRKISDRGVIIFMDDRFTEYRYKRLISNWLKEHIEIIFDKESLLKNELNKFW